MIQIIKSDRHLVTTRISSLRLHPDGSVHVQIMRATMPSASIYTQLNSMVVKVRVFNSLNQAVRRITISPIVNSNKIDMKEKRLSCNMGFGGII
jgi:hypothetical protein